MTISPNPIDRDINLIVGGHFSPDHLGPAVYQQVVQRVQAAPERYLQAFEQRFLRPGVNPLDLADLHLPTFLQLLAARAPQRVRTIGTRLSSLFTSGVPSGPREDWEQVDESGTPDDTTRRRRRLTAHIANLGTIAATR